MTILNKSLLAFVIRQRSASFRKSYPFFKMHSSLVMLMMVFLVVLALTTAEPAPEPKPNPEPLLELLAGLPLVGGLLQGLGR